MNEQINSLMYDGFKQSFPKECACGRTYETELDYISRTKRAGGVGDYLDFSGVLHFLRNCRCKSTIGLEINEDDHGLNKLVMFVTYINEKSKREHTKFIKMLSENPDQLASNPLTGYVAERFSRGKTAEHLLKMDPQAFDNKEEWRQIALNIFRNDYNDWVRKKELGMVPKYRLLVFDDSGNTSKELGDLYIPETRIIHRQDLDSAKDAFRANPEGTSAIIARLTPERRQASEFVHWIRAHDPNPRRNEDCSKVIDPTTGKRYPAYAQCFTGGLDLPIIGLVDGQNRHENLPINLVLKSNEYNLASLIRNYCEGLTKTP